MSTAPDPPPNRRAAQVAGIALSLAASDRQQRLISTVMQVVIADAGPLIALARIDQLRLLRDLFQQVAFTEVVAAELGLEFSAQDHAVRCPVSIASWMPAAIVGSR